MLISNNSINFNVDPMTGDCDGFGFWKRLVVGGWEPHTFNVLQRFLSKENSYIDVGAWVGPTVLFGAQLSKHCYAFEPDPKAFKELQINLKLNPDIKNVDEYQVAISHTTGTVSIGTNTKKGDSMSSLLFQDVESWNVASITLKDCFAKYNIQDCNFIKMDIEGGEALVIPASKDFLKEIQPTLYLSLHTAWMPDRYLFLENIKDALSFYKNIYDRDGNKISLNDLNILPLFTEILATNLEW